MLHHYQKEIITWLEKQRFTREKKRVVMLQRMHQYKVDMKGKYKILVKWECDNIRFRKLSAFLQITHIQAKFAGQHLQLPNLSCVPDLYFNVVPHFK